jgi:PAS domain S-box-containing protein
MFITSLSLYTQPGDIRFKHLTIEDGLSQNSPLCFFQDDNSLMWIGTKGGINRYDGYNFTIFKSDIYDTTSISETHILAMRKDYNDILWIGTQNGLNRLDPLTNTFTRYFHNPNELNSISDNRVNALCEDSFKEFWIGTSNGLNRFNQEKKQFIRYFKDTGNQNSISGNDVRVVYRDKSETIWIGTYGGGLNKFDHETEQFTQYTHDREAPGSLSDNNVLCMHEDRDGILWIGTEKGGLNRFDKEKEQFTCYKTILANPYSLNDNHVHAIHEDRSGRLWIGTNAGGVSIFDRKNEKFFSYQNDPDNPASLGGNQIHAIFEDNTGNIWIGCRGSGISIYNQDAEKFTHYKHIHQNSNSLSNNMVWCFHEDTSGVLWIGTLFGGLNKLDREKNIFTHYVHDNNNPHSISADMVGLLLEDRFGVLWLGTNEGLDKFNRDTERFTHYTFDPDNPNSISNNKIRSLIEDRSGTLWVGTKGGGLNKFDRKTEHFTHYRHDPDDSTSLSNDRVYSLYEDRFNTFWVGTYGGGLNKFDRETDRCIRFKPDPDNIKSLNHDFITEIYEDSSGNFWLGTYGGGLNKFDREKGLFTHYTEKNGLSNNEVYNILEDNNGNLWLSTNNGLSKFDPGKETFKNYYVEDGLQSNEFNMTAAYKSQKGEMIFGGVNGFNVFFPDSIRDNPNIPPVVITDFQIFNTSVPIGRGEDGRSILTRPITETREIILSHKDNVFSFTFAALNYLAPEKNHYAYMMEGFDENWIYSGTRRFATYTNLNPGNYVFRVKGSNNDGLWNEEGTSLRITIIPPYWRTWWFYTLCTIIIIVFATTAYRYRINLIQKQKEEEQRQKILKDFSHILQQGRAAVYRRNVGSNTYEHMGEGIKEITGYDAKDFTVSFWKKIAITTEIEGDLSDTPVKEVFKRLKEGLINSFVMDFNFFANSGKARWIRDITTGLYDKSGKCYAFLGIMFDITDRKLAEQGLARANLEMASDLNMAHEVQLAFLEKQPSRFPVDVPAEKSSLHFHHRYLPATTLAGDFFNIIPISKHKVGIFFCDVMGHGARASLLTAYIQGLIGEIMPVAPDPGVFMEKLNTGLNSIMYQFTQGIFATAFYLVADIKTGKMSYTNTGHPRPLILRRSQGTVENIYTNGNEAEPALGLFKKIKYSVFEGPMGEDDIILFYSDGVYEVDNKDGQIFGRKRLLDSTQNLLVKSPDQLLDGILHDVNSFAKSEDFRDDVCMVTMHVKHV